MTDSERDPNLEAMRLDLNQMTRLEPERLTFVLGQTNAGKSGALVLEGIGYVELDQVALAYLATAATDMLAEWDTWDRETMH